jgi:predicted glutamine amidotransferase
MCRLFGMSAGVERARATFWLLDAPDSLSVQSHREPDGTGLGWFERDGTPRVSKQALAAYGDATFAKRAHDVASRTFIAHIRFASTGSPKPQNTHPFEQAGRLFAHNGVIEDLPTLEAHLGEDMGLVAGDTDSERFFALITREIAARDGDVEGGITAACAWVAEHLPVFAINFVLVSAERVWALRFPLTHELFVLERGAGGALEHASSLGSRVRSPHGERGPLVVIASERMDADSGWRAIRSGELVSVSPTLEVASRGILDSAPVHPLSLEDLGARARRSQSAAAAPDARAGG